MGYAPIPANTPISFYDGDPRTGTANKLNPTFYLPSAIPGNCCSFSYTFILDVGTPGLNKLYGVFNGQRFYQTAKAAPVPPCRRTITLINITSTSNFQFHAAIIPPAATLQPGDTLPLKHRRAPASCLLMCGALRRI